MYQSSKFSHFSNPQAARHGVHHRLRAALTNGAANILNDLPAFKSGKGRKPPFAHMPSQELNLWGDTKTPKAFPPTLGFGLGRGTRRTARTHG